MVLGYHNPNSNHNGVYLNCQTGKGVAIVRVGDRIGIKMNKKVKGVLTILGCVACLTMGSSMHAIAADEKTEKIDDGIYIGSLNMSGMTEEKATKKLSEYVKNARSQEVTLVIGEKKEKITLGDLGYSCDVDKFVGQAVHYGKKGDIIARFKQQKKLEKDNVKFELSFDLDKDLVRDFVKQQCDAYDVIAKNASYVRKNGKFRIKEQTDGSVIVADETVEKIIRAIANQWIEGGIEIDAIVNASTPQYKTTDLEESPSLLGAFSTSFASSDAARSQNLVNAARLLNGYTIYPGEQFSVAEHLVPFTEENGYKVSKAYLNGQVVDSVGGGVCQAATTLYNALLKAELQVDERYNHSMIVGYVKASMDAAISEGNKDLIFTNSLDKPIYLETYTANRCIYFNIYGLETRDLEHRTVEYESEIIETMEPGEDKVTVDPNLPEGYFRVTQSAHTGYVAKLWKIVKEDGKVVSKEEVNNSYYAAEPRYVTKGGKSASSSKPKETKNPKEKDSKKDKTDSKKENSKKDNSKKEKTEATKRPEHTKAPAVTKEPEESVG